MSFHYASTKPDETTIKNVARLSAFSNEQLTALISILFDFLQSKHSGESFVALVDAWAAQQAGGNDRVFQQPSIIARNFWNIGFSSPT
jgi:hypothetical protein